MQSEILSEHPLLSEPSVSFYNWMSNAVGNRGNTAQETPVTKTGHNSLPAGILKFRICFNTTTESLSKIK